MKFTENDFVLIKYLPFIVSTFSFSCVPYGIDPGSEFPKTQEAIVLSEIGYMNGTSVEHKIIFTGSQHKSSAGMVDIYDTQKKSWSHAKLSVKRHSMGVAVVSTKAYFVGGISPDSQQSDIIDIYDSQSDTWGTSNLGVARSAPAVVSVDETLVVAGGFSTSNQDNVIPNAGTNSLMSIELINVQTGVRTQASLSEPRAHFAAVAYGGKAYFIGGFPCFYSYLSACDASNTMDVLDLNDGTLTTIIMPHRRGNLSAALIGSKIVIGGGSSHSGTLDTVDVFDISNAQWSTHQGLALGAGSSATAVDQFAFIVGGTSNKRSILRYNLIDGSLSVSDQLQYGRYNLVPRRPPKIPQSWPLQIPPSRRIAALRY